MIKSIPCDVCKATGEIFNHVSGRHSTCRACRGTTEIFPCERFSSTGHPAMRNRPCDTCHATKRQHDLLVELNALREVKV